MLRTAEGQGDSVLISQIAVPHLGNAKLKGFHEHLLEQPVRLICLFSVLPILFPLLHKSSSGHKKEQNEERSGGVTFGRADCEHHPRHPAGFLQLFPPVLCRDLQARPQYPQVYLSGSYTRLSCTPHHRRAGLTSRAAFFVQFVCFFGCEYPLEIGPAFYKGTSDREPQHHSEFLAQLHTSQLIKVFAALRKSLLLHAHPHTHIDLWHVLLNITTYFITYTLYVHIIRAS